LLQEYEGLPKTSHHGETGAVRHPDIRPEWIMRVIREPHEQWEEVTSDGEVRTIIAGRVPQFDQWIKVVFVGELAQALCIPLMQTEGWKRNMKENRG
jgi:hypothetical protein